MFSRLYFKNASRRGVQNELRDLRVKLAKQFFRCTSGSGKIASHGAIFDADNHFISHDGNLLWDLFHLLFYITRLQDETKNASLSLTEKEAFIPLNPRSSCFDGWGYITEFGEILFELFSQLPRFLVICCSILPCVARLQNVGRHS